MRLAHHPEAIDAIRTPTPHAPWRILLSGCLAGWRCGVQGTDYGLGYRRGVGVAAALLIGEGVPIVSQRDHWTLGTLGAVLDSRYRPEPGVLDYHESPWVLENLPQ